MTAPRVRADYDQLATIAKLFGQEGEATRQALHKITRQMEVLQGGDWIGRGANAFYAEMRQDILPALRRLAQALENGQQVSQQISQIMHEAESSAAGLFRRGGAGGGGAGGDEALAGGFAAGGATGGAFAPGAGAGAGADSGERSGYFDDVWEAIRGGRGADGNERSGFFDNVWEAIRGNHDTRPGDGFTSIGGGGGGGGGGFDAGTGTEFGVDNPPTEAATGGGGGGGGSGGGGLGGGGTNVGAGGGGGKQAAPSPLEILSGNNAGSGNVGGVASASANTGMTSLHSPQGLLGLFALKGELKLNLGSFSVSLGASAGSHWGISLNFGPHADAKLPFLSGGWSFSGPQNP
jgi:WXG100 family type VII secretion target